MYHVLFLPIVRRSQLKRTIGVPNSHHWDMLMILLLIFPKTEEQLVSLFTSLSVRNILPAAYVQGKRKALISFSLWALQQLTAMTAS